MLIFPINLTIHRFSRSVFIFQIFQEEIMPPRRATRNTRAKGPTTLSPEDQQVSSKRRSETLLQYHLTVARPVQPPSGGLWQAVREPQSRGYEGSQGGGRLHCHPLQVCAGWNTCQLSILTWFLVRLELMKIPMETKAMKWEDYFEQNSTSALGLSSAVADVVDDSVVEAVDNQVTSRSQCSC